MNNIVNALEFITVTLLDLYIATILLRVLFQYFRVSFANPIIQFIVRITNPGFKLFRKFIPGFWGIDFAGIIFALLMAATEVIVIKLLNFYSLNLGLFSILGLFITSIFILISILLNIFFYSIILRVLSSFLLLGSGGYNSSYNPLLSLTYVLSEPILRPIRNLIPPIGGFDLSPLFACMAIMVFKILFRI